MVLKFPHWPVSESVEFYVKVGSALLFKKRKGRLPPGPFPLPIIGNLHMVGALLHRALAALSMKHGPLMSLRLGSVLTLVVSSPELAREFLKTHDQLFRKQLYSNGVQYSYNKIIL
jgi:hypothetical protein